MTRNLEDRTNECKEEIVREIIHSQKAPRAIGPYSQAVKTENMIYVSGQIPIDPETGELIGDSIETQTERVLRNLSAILEAGGSSLAMVVKTTVYLTDLKDFEAMNKVYSRFFDTMPPARATVGVSALPRGVAVEIEAIATRTT